MNVLRCIVSMSISATNPVGELVDKVSVQMDLLILTWIHTAKRFFRLFGFHSSFSTWLPSWACWRLLFYLVGEIRDHLTVKAWRICWGFRPLQVISTAQPASEELWLQHYSSVLRIPVYSLCSNSNLSIRLVRCWRSPTVCWRLPSETDSLQSITDGFFDLHSEGGLLFWMLTSAAFALVSQFFSSWVQRRQSKPGVGLSDAKNQPVTGYDHSVIRSPSPVPLQRPCACSPPWLLRAPDYRILFRISRSGKARPTCLRGHWIAVRLVLEVLFFFANEVSRWNIYGLPF